MTLPTSVKKVLLPLGALFVFGAVWYGLFKPEFAKISEYRAQPVAARSQIESMVQRLSAFNPPTAQERAEWTSLEQDIDRRLPREKQFSELYVRLSQLAERNGLQNFERRELEGSEKSFQDWGITRSGYSIELTFECSYPSLIRFLKGLHDMERLVEVVNLEITRKLPLVGIRIVLRSYFIP